MIEFLVWGSPVQDSEEEVMGLDLSESELDDENKMFKVSCITIQFLFSFPPPPPPPPDFKVTMNNLKFYHLNYGAIT